jgi:hypothetical protein
VSHSEVTIGISTPAIGANGTLAITVGSTGANMRVTLGHRGQVITVGDVVESIHIHASDITLRLPLHSQRDHRHRKSNRMPIALLSGAHTDALTSTQ